MRQMRCENTFDLEIETTHKWKEFLGQFLNLLFIYSNYIFGDIATLKKLIALRRFVFPKTSKFSWCHVYAASCYHYSLREDALIAVASKYQVMVLRENLC